MRVGPVMDAEADDIERAADLAGLRIVKHLVLGRAEVEVVGGFFQVREVGERYGNAILHQTRGLNLLLRRDQVEGAALVVLTPAAPVRKFGLPATDLLDADGRMLGRRRGFGVRRNPNAEGCSDEQGGSQNGCGNEAFHCNDSWKRRRKSSECLALRMRKQTIRALVTVAIPQ